MPTSLRRPTQNTLRRHARADDGAYDEDDETTSTKTPWVMVRSVLCRSRAKPTLPASGERRALSTLRDSEPDASWTPDAPRTF